jgi:hypothetical protein
VAFLADVALSLLIFYIIYFWPKTFVVNKFEKEYSVGKKK